MAGGVVGIDFDRAAVLAFCDGPVEVMTNSCEAERAVGFGGSRIQLHCFGGVLFCGRRSFCERPNAENAKPVVVIGDAGVGESIIRIQLDRFLVTLERFCETDFRVRVPVITTAEISLESFGTVSATFR